MEELAQLVANYNKLVETRNVEAIAALLANAPPDTFEQFCNIVRPPSKKQNSEK